MSQLQCIRVKLREGTTERVTTFLRSLNDRPEEVRASLESEGIERECLFLDRTDEGDFLIFLTRAENLETAATAFQASDHPLDIETRELIAETWEEVRPLELLADLP